MADKQHENGETGSPEPGEVTEVTQASAPAEAEPSAAPAAKTQSAVSDEDDEVTAVAAAPARRPSRLRRLLVGLLIFLSCLAVVVTGLTLWTHYTVMNTDGYMNLVGPIGKDPEAIQNLSEYVGGQVVAATDLQQRVTDALPDRVQLLAGPITSYVEDFITKGANKVLSSPRAYELWLEVNRRGHEKIVALLRGETTNAYIAGSDVKLNLLPLVSQVLLWVDERLPGGLSDRLNPPVIEPGTDPEAGIQEVANWSGKPLPSDFGQITLLQADALGPAQTAVKWFDRLTWVLPLVTVGLIALTIWLSRRRARTAIAIGIGAAIAIFVTRVIVKRASLYLTDKLQEGQGDTIVRDVVNASLGPLTTITIWICVIGVVAALLVWLLGRRDVRAGVVAAGRRAVGQAAEISIPDSPVTSWIVNHVVGVRWGVLVVGLIVLALVASSWLGIILSIVVVLLLEGFLSFMTGQWPFNEREGDESTAT
ncbi:MAG TPA: hypothetical protein VFZ86_02205 [Thermoleophilia bacterium]|nr:hypothetical protein [Thermoleophilia bacterium]